MTATPVPPKSSDAPPSLSLVFDRSGVAGDGYIASIRERPPALEVGPLDETVRAAARRGWEDRARSEYVGVMVVRHLHGLLVDLNAPMDVQELALTMMLHEQRHTELCIDAARALGSDGAITFDVAELRMNRSREPLDRQLWRMILGTYLVGEVTALGLLRHAIKALPRSGFRDLLRRIARDEVLHGRFGPLLLRDSLLAQRAGRPHWLAYPGDDWVVTTVRQQVEAMKQRDVIESDEAELFADPARAAALKALGIPHSDEFKQAYLDALDRDVGRALRWAMGA